MALTFEERLANKADLEQLYEAVPSIGAGDLDQVRVYIDVGEYGLALDDLADRYLEAKKLLPPDIRGLFDKLATRMGMKSGDEWRAVAELLSIK